jgi:kynurenine 3-monooxygenase
MTDRSGPDVVVVGAGLVGSLAAVFFSRRGMRVDVFERFPDIRGSRAGAGRSINLVVASRGIWPLERAGLVDGVLELTVPVLGRMMHALDGELAYQPYGRDDSECNYSISRAELNRFLIDRAESLGVRFHFERPLVAADLEAGRLQFGVGDTEDREAVVAERIVGADGAASVVRAELMKLEGHEESVELLDYGYKELTIGAGDDGGYRIEKQVLHIWPRGRTMLMALPNRDGSFTVTLYLPFAGDSSFAELDDAGKVRAFFETQFPDAVPLITDLESSFLANPTGELGTVRCRPWHHDGRVLLMGDAAHAVVPFFGQGMNCGFEDCRVLDELLDEHGDDWARAAEAYTEARKPNGDAIAAMALDNFVEMRDRVGDPAFLLRKEVEHRLEEAIPREYRSRYSMVMYGKRIPYSVAREAGRIQQGILDDLCEGLDSAAALDLERARALIRGRLAPYLEERQVGLDY